MKKFFARLGRTVLDLVTSKKAIAAVATAAAGAIAPKLGANQEQVAGIIVAGVGYVLAQAHADKGKEAEKKAEQFRRERLIAAGLATVDQDGNLLSLHPSAVAAGELK